ncbi:MAG: hypothetical protein WC050_01700 [Candidatus Paceibacterota bacterium]
MQWVRSHRYTLVCAAIALLILTGGYIVLRRSPASVSSTPTAWGGSATSLIDPASYSPSDIPAAIVSGVSLGGPAPAFSAIPPSQNGTVDDTDAEYDMNVFLASITQPEKTGGADIQGTSSVSLAYSFIPQGLISTSIPVARRSVAQQALYDYGNELGSDIMSYEDTHFDSAVVLTNQVQDRQNPQKAQAVRDIGTSLIALGQKAADIERVPSSAASLNADLAKSYKDMGAKLAKIPDAQRDADYLAAITDYNAAVNTFITQYVSLATLFSVSGVKFTTGEGGSVFMFSGGSAL